MTTARCIVGLAAAGLLAAILGIAGNLAAEVRDGEPATPAEWLEAVQREAAAEKGQWDAHWRDVMKGAALAMEPYDGRPEMIAGLAGEPKRLYDAYRLVWDEHAKAVADKLLAGKAVDDAERKYRFLASGTLLHRFLRGGIRGKEQKRQDLSAEERSVADYARAVENAGRAALAKGYRGGALTAGDIDVLRDYAMFVDARCTGGGVLPFHLGLTRWEHGKGGRPMPGDSAPDFALARMEAFLDSPAYSDANPRDPTDILTPLAAREFLQIMCGFELRDGKVRPKPYGVVPGRQKQYVRLSGYRGRQPVLLVFMNATDPWAWHGKIAPMLEPLKQALGERLAVHFICTTIHDTRMASMDFTGPKPGKATYVHEAAMEHRARICKMFHMGWPDCTTDYLLDDMAQHFRNEWLDQGGGAYIVLIDSAGTIAYADYHQDIPPHWGPNAVDFPYEFLTIRMNHLESRLASFFASGGRYDNRMEAAYPTWRLPASRRGASTNARIGVSLWMPARVTAVDAGGKRVTVERTLPPPERMKGIRFWDEAGARASAFDPATKARLDTVRAWLADPREKPTHGLLLGDATDVFVDGWAKPPADLRVGDRVGVCFPAGQDASRELRPVQIRIYRMPAGARQPNGGR